MITGFNTNVPYRGRVFHVQTEDSGRAHPHLITHVYFGGTILASEKTSYADLVDSPDLVRDVRALMEAQHKRMLARLDRGELDAVIAERLDGAVAGPMQTRPEGPPPRPEVQRPELPRSGPRRGPAPGAPPAPRAQAQAPAAAPPVPAPAAGPGPRHGFGDGVLAEKSLDTLILDYLVEKARAQRKPG